MKFKALVKFIKKCSYRIIRKEGKIFKNQISSVRSLYISRALERDLVPGICMLSNMHLFLEDCSFKEFSFILLNINSRLFPKE